MGAAAFLEGWTGRRLGSRLLGSIEAASLRGSPASADGPVDAPCCPKALFPTPNGCADQPDHRITGPWRAPCGEAGRSQCSPR